MGCGGNHQHPCEEIFVAILLRIDHELIDPNLELALTQHCDECPPCLETLAAHESNVRLIKQLLGNTCREEAPESLHERLIAQVQEQADAMEMAASGFTQTFTQTFMQRSITSDGEVTIEISHTQEFREGF
jgi:hypothetical protein